MEIAKRRLKHVISCSKDGAASENVHSTSSSHESVTGLYAELALNILQSSAAFPPFPLPFAFLRLSCLLVAELLLQTKRATSEVAKRKTFSWA